MRMMAIQRITENTKATKEIPIQNCTHKGGPAAEGRPHSGSNVIFHGICNGIAHAQLDISCICLFDHSVFAWVVIYNQPTFCSWGGGDTSGLLDGYFVPGSLPMGAEAASLDEVATLTSWAARAAWPWMRSSRAYFHHQAPW